MTYYPAQPTSLLHTLNFKAVNPLVVAQISYPGVLDINTYKEAIGKLAVGLPQLLCRYDISTNTFVSIGKTVEDIVHTLDTDASPFDRTYDFQNEPQFHVFYKVDAGQSTLTYVISHIVADGASLKEIIYTLSNYANNPSFQIQENRQEMGDVYDQFIDYDTTKLTRNDSQSFDLKLPFPRMSEGESLSSRIHHLQLSHEETQTLKVNVKHSGFTFNDVLLASFMRILKHYNHNAPYIAIACPTDTRQFLPTQFSNIPHIGNYTARYNPIVNVGLTESINQTTEKVHKEMTTLKEGYQFLQSVLPLYLHSKTDSIETMRNDARKNYHSRSIAYTNMAVFSVSKLHIQNMIPTLAFTSGSFRTAPSFQICFSSFNGHLNLVANVIGTPSQHQFAIDIMNNIKSDLLSY